MYGLINAIGMANASADMEKTAFPVCRRKALANSSGMVPLCKIECCKTA